MAHYGNVLGASVPRATEEPGHMHYQPFFIELYAQCETDERRRQSKRQHLGETGIVVRLIGIIARSTERLSAAVERWAAGTSAGVLHAPTSARAR